MKRKKTRSVASYRAASLKGARTRQRMQHERYAEALGNLVQAVDDRLTEIIETRPQTNYRALPNPWFDMVRK